jgi:hypothetical protein
MTSKSITIVTGGPNKHKRTITTPSTAPRNKYRVSLQELIDQYVRSCWGSDVYLQDFYAYLASHSIDVSIHADDTYNTYKYVRDGLELGTIEISFPSTTGGDPVETSKVRLDKFKDLVDVWWQTKDDEKKLEQQLQLVAEAMCRFVRRADSLRIVCQQRKDAGIVMRLIVGCLAGLRRPMSQISAALSGAVGACFRLDPKPEKVVTYTSASIAQDYISETSTAADLLLLSIPSHADTFFLVHTACFLYFVTGIRGITEAQKQVMASMHYMHPVMMNRSGDADGSHNLQREIVHRLALNLMAAYAQNTFPVDREYTEVFFGSVFPPLPPLWFEIVPCMRLRAVLCNYCKDNRFFKEFNLESSYPLRSYSMQTLYETAIEITRLRGTEQAQGPRQPPKKPALYLQDEIPSLKYAENGCQPWKDVDSECFSGLKVVRKKTRDALHRVVFSLHHGVVFDNSDNMVVPPNMTLVLQGMVGKVTIADKKKLIAEYKCNPKNILQEFANSDPYVGCDIMPSGYTYPDMRLAYDASDLQSIGCAGVFYCDDENQQTFISESQCTTLRNVVDLVSRTFRHERIILIALHCQKTESLEKIRTGTNGMITAMRRLPKEITVLHNGKPEKFDVAKVLHQSVSNRVKTLERDLTRNRGWGEITDDPNLLRTLRQQQQALSTIGGGGGSISIASLLLILVTSFAAFAHPSAIDRA